MVNTVILTIIALVVGYGLFKGVDVYGAFTEGAREGLQTTLRIFPHMVALMVGVSMLRASGATDLLAKLFAPVFSLFKIPIELLPLVILKPFSGGAALGVLADIYTAYGVDSRIGIIASAVMGSSETIFYTVALYFGYAGVKNTKYTIPCALLAAFAGVLGAVAAVNLLF
ncbi:MAG: spore maturation protein [Clostridia bacterium]|nr:spore maturation protein [Clostridia bacterium]